MSRIEPSANRPATPEGVPEQRPVYQDVAELTGLRAKLNGQEAGLLRPTLPALFREAFTRSAESPTLPAPDLPVSHGRRWGASELRMMTRKLLDRHGRIHERDASRSSAESELLATLEAMLRAQESLQSRIAELRKS